MNRPVSQAQTQVQPTRPWFICVNQHSYGPFDDRTIWQFMCEGRVQASSLISPTPSSGYTPVSDHPELMGWLSQIPNQAPAAPPVTPQSPTPDPATLTPTPVENPVSDSPASVFIIMAEIRSNQAMSVLQALQNLGQVSRIGDTVWIMHARATAQSVQAALAIHLDTNDRLFIFDSLANETAWFNLNPEMMAQISALWDSTS